ncbi:MAG: hypothetical protein QMD06_03550 [Candidatus Altarchaeum sp.]|nr:hypothetical protein [Candidatus Altarchaeum sp.]
MTKNSNFVDIIVCGKNVDRYFDNVKEMSRQIDQLSLVSFLEQITDDKDRKIFRDKVVKIMIERTQNEARKCFETFRKINIFAGK